MKNEYYLVLLTPETIKLFRSTKNKITKDENDENVPDLRITELLYCNNLTNDYHQNS